MPQPPRSKPPFRQSFRHRPRKRPPEALPPEFADATRGIRLQKVLAAAGVASRRDCEELITDGHVTVNGHRITALPAWVDPAHDRIEVKGQVIATGYRTSRGSRTPAPPGAGALGPDQGSSIGRGKTYPGRHVYVMLNKPRRVISTTDDPEDRRTVTQMVQIEDLAGPRRLFPVGRLDADSSGLILLTDDGELANRLTHPRYGIAKEYHVSVRGALTEADLRRLRDGLYLTQQLPGTRGKPRDDEGGARGTPPGKRKAPQRDTDDSTSAAEAGPSSAALPIKKASMESVSVIRRQRDVSSGDRTVLKVVLREGQNREIRRMMARLGLKVRRLQRVAIGPLRLKTLSSGHWRVLTSDEAHTLRRAAGL